MKIKIATKHGHKTIDLNRRKAIKAKCLNCSGWLFTEVRGCEFKACSLHSFRTGQGWQDAKVRNAAIRAYCLWCMNGQLTAVSKCESKNCSLWPYRKSQVDRGAEIKPLLKNTHIGVSPESENKKPSDRSPYRKKFKARTPIICTS